MQANDEESVDALVRRRLRELRASRGLTLAQVSERAHIDISTLSRLESGKRRLALDHIPALARALGVSADDLLHTAPAEDPFVRGKPRRFQGLTMWELSRDTGAGPRVFKMVVAAGRSSPPSELPSHEGHEWLYVISGRLRLLLGDHEHVVGPGEAVEFSTWRPHWFGAVQEEVELIAIFGPQGERIHLHA
jgi:transcriptional regulator with XRE-family HTH domain